MEKYTFDDRERSILERLRQPLAVYQFVNRRIVSLILSDGFCALFGYTDPAQAYYDMDHDMYKDTHPDDTARIADAALRFATEGGRYEVIYRAKIKGGTQYHMVHAFGEHVCPEEGVRLAYVWYADEGVYSGDADFESGRLNPALSNALHEESILKASYFDYLTGLPSMTHFFDLAAHNKAEIICSGGLPAMMYIDFSGMKFYNAKHGFAEGDKLLQAFSKILSSTFSVDRCCRIGADHFAAIAESEGLEARLDELLRRCRDMNCGNSLPVHIGVYVSRNDNVHASVACDRAKLACGALGGSYRSGYNFYTPNLSEDAEMRRYVVENLDRALQEHWIQVYYQPIVRAVDEKVCDEEALARWIDPVRGLMSPASFIPALEDARLIYKLDLYVLEQVLGKILEQQKAGLYVVPHSINLSRSDFDVCDMAEEIRRRVDEAGISRDKITIEITESVIGSNFAFMKEQIRRFQELGFPVWMDDFGTGYSSLDVLQSIKFDLIKFDMSFMRRLDEGGNGKIILTELMKMTNALETEAVCEGVETEDQARFLMEIGCAKLQGYYYCKPIPFSKIIERYRQGTQIGFENPAESNYYETVGRVNLYDLAVMTNVDESSFQNIFNTIPMGIIEVQGNRARFMRSNPSYREFMKRFFGFDLATEGSTFARYDDSFMYNVVKTCVELGARSLYDEKMPDGSVVHFFARRVSVNPITGSTAVGIAVLSITEPDANTSYADIARALAADYYNIYAVDLDTERFIEYSSPVGRDVIAMERHGEHFFDAVRRDAMARIFEEDRELFLRSFTKENIVRDLDAQGSFSASYRLIDSGEPQYVNMKITRMLPYRNRIIIGISIVDSQMKQFVRAERLQREETAYARIMALSGEYLSLYTVDPISGNYFEYTATQEYKSLGFSQTGEDFFRQAVIDSKASVFEEDLPMYLDQLRKDKILDAIREHGQWQLRYRLMIGGEPRMVLLKIVPVKENDGEKLIVGLREWIERR